MARMQSVIRSMVIQAQAGEISESAASKKTATTKPASRGKWP